MQLKVRNASPHCNEMPKRRQAGMLAGGHVAEARVLPHDGRDDRRLLGEGHSEMRMQKVGDEHAGPKRVGNRSTYSSNRPGTGHQEQLQS